jgi:hypothetical protein
MLSSRWQAGVTRHSLLRQRPLLHDWLYFHRAAFQHELKTRWQRTLRIRDSSYNMHGDRVATSRPHVKISPHTIQASVSAGTAPAVDENAGHLVGGGVATHHDVDVAACSRSEVPDRRPSSRRRTGLAWVPWRISYSPLIHQMKCYTKPLKSHTERVGRQFLSLRQDALSGHSFSAPDQWSKSRRLRPFLTNCPNHEDRLEGPLRAVFRLSRLTFSEATEPRPFWYGC